MALGLALIARMEYPRSRKQEKLGNSNFVELEKKKRNCMEWKEIFRNHISDKSVQNRWTISKAKHKNSVTQ